MMDMSQSGSLYLIFIHIHKSKLDIVKIYFANFDGTHKIFNFFAKLGNFYLQEIISLKLTQLKGTISM